MAQRVAYRYMVARTYKEYVQDFLSRKENRGKKPKSKKEWEGGEKQEDGGKSKGLGGRIKGLLKSIPNISKKMANALAKAPAETQRFFVDKEHRDKVTKAAGKALKEGGKKAAKAIYSNAIKELKSFGKAKDILTTAIKEKKMPSKEDRKVLYGVGVYVAGTAIGGVTGALGGAGILGAIGGAGYGASKALIHSLGLHIGIGAASGAADELFLHTETAESIGTMTGHAQQLGVGTGDIPGIGHIMDMALSGAKELGKLVLGAENGKGDDDMMERYVHSIYNNIADRLEKGISDEDIKAMLQAG